MNQNQTRVEMFTHNAQLQVWPQCLTEAEQKPDRTEATMQRGVGQHPSTAPGRAHLELLRRRHVGAEHSLPQHGDRVALAANFLNLFTGSVAAEQQRVKLMSRELNYS